MINVCYREMLAGSLPAQDVKRLCTTNVCYRKVPAGKLPAQDVKSLCMINCLLPRNAGKHAASPGRQDLSHELLEMRR